ncbi:MAG: glutaredoxin family protein [Nitrospiraceae bacterium]|nr:glutaredoxin family protein [Nitrospiraceae bacterium]
MTLTVKIYSLSTCSHCSRTKKLLSDCAVQYEFTDLDLLMEKDRDALLEEVKRFNPACTFPTILIGDRVIVGYREQEIRSALGL